jgi:sulfane dehydrogenase subunit SoxC
MGKSRRETGRAAAMGRAVEVSEDARVAGGGLLDRRLFLGGALGGAAAGGATFGGASTAEAEALGVPAWMRTPGSTFVGYGQPSKHEAKTVRTFGAQPNSPGTGASRTPHHLLHGTITPSGLHFERSHNGIPDIDPDSHRLLVHGLVKRPLVFTLESLARYPMESQTAFIECGGNSGALYGEKPVQGNIQALHGLVSCAEWTGVRVRTLLAEAGVDPKATWVYAEGADAAGMSRSVPLAKMMDDAMIALYQNGERVRPSNGYPMRLLLPGYEGNMQVKWLRRLKVTDGPVMARDETSKYTLLMESGKSLQFFFPIEAKSFITHPSPGLTMRGKGAYEISGLAWSGNGRITKVEVSADSGKSWARAQLQEPVVSRSLTRFRLPWAWDGAPATLMSRATDQTGYVQPTRTKLLAERGGRAQYHFNGIACWAVSDKGEVSHVYA